MTIKKEDLVELPTSKFYLILEVEDFYFDRSYSEFSKVIHKEMTKAVQDLRQVIESAYIRRNSATPEYMENEDGR